MVVNLEVLINVGVLLGVVVVYFGFRYFIQTLVNLISPNINVPAGYASMINNKEWDEDMNYSKSDAFLRGVVLKR